MKTINRGMKAILALVILALGSANVQADTSAAESAVAEKRRAVTALMDNIGMSKLLLQMTDGMTQAFMISFTDNVRRSGEKVTGDELKIASEESAAVFRQHVPELLNVTASLYEKYFTLEEIRQLSAFYATPAGKKSIQVMPALAQESMDQGLVWGRSLGPQIDQRIKNRIGAKPKKEQAS